MQRRNIKKILDTCAVVEMFVNNTVTESPSTFNILSFFASVIGITTRTRNIINKKPITQSSCYIFGVAINLNFINIILSLESNGTSFNAIKSNFAEARLAWRKSFIAIVRQTNVNGQYLRWFSIEEDKLLGKHVRDAREVKLLIHSVRRVHET